MGRTICDRDSLFKRSIPPYDCRWRPTHDANQWQVLKEVLSLIKDPSLDQVNTTPLIKISVSGVHIKRAFLFLQARLYNHKPTGTWPCTAYPRQLIMLRGIAWLAQLKTVVGKGISNPLIAGGLLKILRDLFPFDSLSKVTYQFSSIEW